jgi:hypothetical protein
MKLSALTYSKGTLSPHYLVFAFLLGPIPTLLGAALAPNINWFHAVLLSVGVYITYTIAHCVHDLGHATPEYRTLSPGGLKILAVILAILSIGFIVYFTIAVSLWVLAFGAVIPLCVLYRRGLIYSPFSLSGGTAICVLGGYFIMTETLSLPAILMALFVMLFGHAGLLLYKMDEWLTESPVINQELYSRAVNYLGLMLFAFVPLTIALLLN